MLIHALRRYHGLARTIPTTVAIVWMALIPRTAIAGCEEPDGRLPHLVVDLPTADREALKYAAAGGRTIVVQYKDCKIRVLPQCHASGFYRYQTTVVSEEHVSVTNSSLDVYLPHRAANLEAKLQAGGKFDIGISTVGVFMNNESIIYEEYLEGKCGKATHFVQSVSVGAFDTNPSVEGVAPEGDRSMCLVAGQGDIAPPADCNAPIRVQLTKLTEGFPASHTAGSHTHDGFFMRLEVGGGYLTSIGGQIGTTEWIDYDGDYKEIGVEAAGPSLGGAFFLGWTPYSGLAFGVASIYVATINAKIQNDGGDVTIDNASVGFVVFGPFLQYYPSIHGGFNIGLVLGMGPSRGYPRRVYVGEYEYGLDWSDNAAASASLGYDWWIAKEWSLGAAARVTLAHVWHRRSSLDLITPSLNLAITYH